MPESHVATLMQAIEETALRDLNVELGLWQVALGQGDSEGAARARSALREALDVYMAARLERTVALEEEGECE